MVKLKVHDGITGPRQPVEIVKCRPCTAWREAHDLPATELRAELMSVWLGPSMDANGRLFGGELIWICRGCASRGEMNRFGTGIPENDLDFEGYGPWPEEDADDSRATTRSERMAGWLVRWLARLQDTLLKRYPGASGNSRERDKTV